jgi:hypothetical protein
MAGRGRRPGAGGISTCGARAIAAVALGCLLAVVGCTAMSGHVAADTASATGTGSPTGVTTTIELPDARDLTRRVELAILRQAGPVSGVTVHADMMTFTGVQSWVKHVPRSAFTV